ncbi:unnamed protein product [Rhizoctonia solani]|uniref:Uncharacterized protein n=1 Tax=Rhizoctonia solani TaxID=456999 RepID=A0A8H3D180_9AGAM|nr:unnamed protein product [Rhizoctonia solani]
MATPKVISIPTLHPLRTWLKTTMDYTDGFKFTNKELEEAGLLGVSQVVIQTIEAMKKYPKLLDGLTLFMLQCQNDCAKDNVPCPPTSSTLSASSSASSGTLSSISSATLSTIASSVPSSVPFSVPRSILSQFDFDASCNATTAEPYVISDYERVAYYRGISSEPPELLYRSDLCENPFPVLEGRFPHPLTKTVHGVFNTALNPIWDTVAPQICTLLENLGIRYSVVKAARFVTHGQDDRDTLGPIVIWIATHPTTTTAKDAYHASPPILNLLKTNGVEGVVVEWYEGALQELSGPALLRVTDTTNPTHYVRQIFTPALGMPIIAEEREGDDAQGSVAFFFHENKTKKGNTSTRVLGVTNNHVLRKDATTPYKFRGAGAPSYHVRLAGDRRFQRALDEIKAFISHHTTQASHLAALITELEQKPTSKDQEEAADDRRALEVNRDQLVKEIAHSAELETFYQGIFTQWNDPACRNIGRTDWAPGISIGSGNYDYTQDVATFELDEAKFKAQFRGNVVDLGTKFTPEELTRLLHPRNDGQTKFKFPHDRQLRIQGCLTHQELCNPQNYDLDELNGLIFMKDGNTTDLTVGRYAGLPAYTCRLSGAKSTELAVYNYNDRSGPFSFYGDSGSLVFDGKGRMVGILHTGMPRGLSNHVTYVTPAWWIIEKIRLQYPNADFCRKTF